MKWSLSEINKKKYIDFNESLELAEELKGRSQEILDAKNVQAIGSVAYDDGLYYLDYQLKANLTLPSSRSLKPVDYPMEVFVSEIFSTEDEMKNNEELLNSDMIFNLEKDLIDLDESVADNILLEIPLKILAEDESEEDEALPAGQNWTVLSEEAYAKAQAEKEKEAKEKASPFAGLSDFLNEK
ncbi:YceD family protein [Lactococcus termiticola]|uniref:DNA-binding protein n=1 Tax=Lactococcus termiticola TaxID=2169526 RepID=A0A2R5HH18_9LACT|nr:YceD family protein [Lactococcus termiticola]GBG96645.1 DNA-binding protein [Lactococcus termiticola]